MGRRNKAYSKDLHQQAYDRLTGMQAFGESKKEAVANGTDKEKIFSFNTYKSYWKHTKYFIEYIKSEHPECTTLKSAKKYVNEWLQVRADQGLSAWTVQLEAKAMGKLYGISPDDKDYFQPPKRNRADIKRSRGDRVRDRHFSITNNDELIKFCKGTGLRRSELGALKGGDLLTKEQIEKEGIKESENMAEQIENNLKSTNVNNQVEITATSKYVMLNMNGGVLFNSGDAELTPEAVKLLDSVADAIYQYNDNYITIEGHTDSNPISTAKYPDNMMLSVHRAHSVYNYLVKNKNFDSKTMTASGRGENVPVADNSTAEGRAQNRRVEIRIYNNLNKDIQ